MIQASELRIGLCLLVCGEITQISSGFIADYDFSLRHNFSNNTPIARDSVFPVPITPEILEKARFDKTCENEYRKGRLTFQFAKYQDGFIMSVFLDGSLMCILKYLHQLQNLYFALTGEELQIDLQP